AGGGGPHGLTYINLEGWNQGVNLLSDDKKLTQATKSVLIKSKEIIRQNPDLTIEEAIGIALNGKLEKAFKQAGIALETIRIEAPATRATILDQMRPYMPTESLLKSNIESIARHYTNSKKTFVDLSSRIAKYYDENLNAFSKQSIIEDLKVLNSKINNFAKNKNISPENIYLVRPIFIDKVKSFDLINKMYVDLFNIPESKNIKINSVTELNDYPKNSAFVILDDIIGSGASMSEVGQYLFNSSSIHPKQHVLFCPVAGTQNGVDYLQEVIELTNRQKSDAILNIAENTKDYTNTKDLFTGDSELARKILGDCGHGQFSMCTVLPYMAPDNNSTLASYLTRFFVPEKDCIKNRNELLPAILEETYYYDIFGTSKDKILTDGAVVYGLKPEKTIFERVKNLFNGDKI
ncbi:MAG: hypothetical protein NC390_03845, partial [Fusobacterium sp.]|nr:hypothetical protein [Fusobacterium sp.]